MGVNAAFMRLSNERDTIAAVATPPGHGGVGIVRISGPGARDVLGKLWAGKLSVSRFESHRQYYGKIMHEGVLVDLVLASWMRGPKSYTGEDVVEISGHGGPAVMGRLLAACCDAGARAAEPGEFTKRAFLNGRIDLVQAEAIADIIAATSDEGVRRAQEQLSGRLSQEIACLQDGVAELRAGIEASIDFPEEDIDFVAGEDVAGRLAALIADGLNLAGTFAEGRLVREGVRVVVAGRPNAGKSSLFNALVGDERAIVHHEPGTTRDVVECSVSLEGIVFHLRDTAGMGETLNEVERLGIDRSRDELSRADLVVYVVDSTAGMSDADEATLSTLPSEKTVLVYNKIDLCRCSCHSEGGTTEESLVPVVILREERPKNPLPSVVSVKQTQKQGILHYVQDDKRSKGSFATLRMTNNISLSAVTGEGIDALRTKLVEFVTVHRGGGDAEGVVVTNVRHSEALGEAIDALQAAAQGLKNSQPLECAAESLRGAHESLGRIVGSVSVEDVLSRIFARFCVGK